MSGAVEISRKHDEWRANCINLIPSENIMSPAARQLLAGDMASRYTMPVNAEVHGGFVENAYRGTKYIDEMVAYANGLACEVFGARRATFAPLSGHIAGMIALSALCSPGDLIMSLGSDAGGYDGYCAGYMPDMMGLRWRPLAFDADGWNVDVERSAGLIRAERPRLVILGASFFPFPHDVKAISDACKDSNTILAYDGSHVFGLIAGGSFQDPLAEGADVLIGNTHKSFFGPQGGALLANDEELFERLCGKLTWHCVDNLHWNRIAATARALEEMRDFGADYARGVVANSKALAASLDSDHLTPRFDHLDYTESHQVILDEGRVKSTTGLDLNALAVLLESQNIITDAVGRLGTSEVTRLGMNVDDMAAVAGMVASAARGNDVLDRVTEFRSGFSPRFC